MKGRNLTTLTELDVRAIHADPRKYNEIAIDFSVSVMTISNIKNGKSWKHLNLASTGRRKTYNEHKDELKEKNRASTYHTIHPETAEYLGTLPQGHVFKKNEWFPSPTELRAKHLLSPLKGVLQ